MSASSIPLKIKNSDGDLQELSPSEEMYLAVKVGEALTESDSGDVGDLSLTTGTNIGSFVDTYYNEPAGTHSASNITGTTVTTTLRQVDGSASESGSDFVRPVGYYASDSNPGFYEMVDDDLNSLVSRILKNVETLDLQGSFQLSEISPGGDWAKHIDTVFSDTLSNGTSTNYHIWKKVTLGTPPVGVSTIRPMSTSYDGSSFDGFKEMSDEEIKYTLGQRAKTLRATTGAIGSYQLRSSAQGVPSAAGVWESRGSALNTQPQLVDQTYTRTRVSAYTRNRTSTYTRNTTNNSVSEFSTGYTRESILYYSRNFTGEYTSPFGEDALPFVGNYARVSTRVAWQMTRYSTYTRNSAIEFVGNFVGNYARTFTAEFVGNYTRTNTIEYVGDFVGDYTRTSTVDYSSEFEYARIRESAFVGEFTGNYSRDFVGNYSNSYFGEYVGPTISDSLIQTSETYTLYVRVA